MSLRKFALLLSVQLLVSGIAPAKNQWTIHDVAYDVDTLAYPQQIGPGITFSKFSLSSYPLKVSVLQVDMTNPYADIETAMPDYAINRAVPAEMTRKYSREGHRVIGAINSDLSSLTSEPVNSGQFMNGEMIVSPSNMMAFALDENRKPFIDHFSFDGRLMMAGDNLSINKLNAIRYVAEQQENVIYLYTDRYFTDTNLTNGGKKVIISPAEGEFHWQSNEPIEAVVDSIFENDGHTMIPPGKAVLWIKGSGEQSLSKVNVGDHVTVTLTVNLRRGAMKHIEQMAGGMDMYIMREGNMVDVWEERHPRTCMGFNADSTQIFMFIIDGRQLTSAGATLSECYYIMKTFGVSTAINLDGGGSSCMVVNNEVVNSPSDGTVRPVGNCFMAISTAPCDEMIDSICFEPRTYTLPASGVLPLTVWGYNSYGDLLTRDLEGCTFACDPSLGIVDEHGVFTATGSSAAGFVTATLGDVTTRQFVSIVPTAKALTADSVLIDFNHPYAVNVVPSDTEITSLSINPSAMTWFSTDEQVCTVNEDGVITAVTNGTAFVVGAGDGFSDSLKVTVQNPVARVSSVENAPIDPSTWHITQSGGSGRVVTPYANAFAIDFKTASSRSPYIRIAKTIDYYGIPDTLRLRYRPEHIKVSRVSISSHVNVGNQIITNLQIPDSLQAEPQTLDIPMSEICDNADLSIYPIGLNYINFTVTPDEIGIDAALKISDISLIYDGVEGLLKGDVNADGVVNTSDVTSLINVILELEQQDVERADIDANGVVDVSDVTALINLILI